MPNFWNRLINIGLDESHDFTERKKTMLLNIYGLIGIPACLYFLVENLVRGVYSLVFIDIILLLAASGFLIINSRFHKHQSIRVILITIISIALALSAIFFKNEGENLLLFNIILCYLIFNGKWIVRGLISFNSLLYLFVKFSEHTSLYPAIRQLSVPRTMFIAFVGLLLIILCIQYFKVEHAHHLQQINNYAVQLQNQQASLIRQKIELEEKNQQLEVLNQTKEKLFSIVAHDTRTPINSLKGLLDLFNKKYITPEEFNELLSTLSSQVDQLQNNLDNLLQWSVSQMNGIQVSSSNFQLSKLLKEVVSLLQTTITTKKINIDLHCNELISVHADINHVRLILNNLITNAIKFSYVGSTVTINVSENDNHVSIEVKDRGKGIDKEKIDLIFSFSAKKSTTGTLNEKGTGVGLILCKEFAEKNKGGISVISEQGKGSCFTVHLPRRYAYEESI